MVKHPDRQKHVRELNNAAKACGLQGIRDDVGRQAVLEEWPVKLTMATTSIGRVAV